MSELKCLDRREFLATPRLVLMDLEITCWPDSFRTWWADPARPPEVLEVGLALYDLGAGRVVSTFSSLVRPAINPILSNYCLTLLKIPQADVDSAGTLADVVQQVGAWEEKWNTTDTPTCTWCTVDRRWLHDDAIRSGCPDPFAGRPHVNLSSLLMESLGDDPQTVPPRDSMTARLGLPPIPDRHRALADTVDLGRFCSLLMHADQRLRPVAGA